MQNNNQKLVYMGCGHHRMAGFCHVEINIGKNKSGPPDILADMTEQLPLEDNSVDLVYSRATLEHLTYRELINNFLECQRILKTGGYLRAVVPSFDLFIKEYENKIYWPDLKGSPDFPNENYVDSFVFNALYHDHYYLHNFDTLARALRKTGFDNVVECGPGETNVKSASHELLEAEIARHGEIIIEAKKTGREPEIEKYGSVYPKNQFKKILAKYFNIKISSYKKRKPMFPQRGWFREKIKNIRKNKSNNFIISGSHGQADRQPRWESRLDLSVGEAVVRGRD